MPTLSRCELVTFTRARRSHSQAPSAVARQPDRPTQVARAHSFVAEGEHHPPEPAALVSNVAERPYLVLRNLADISPLPPYTTSTSGLPTPTGTRGKTTTAIDSPITASDSYVIREIHAGIAAYSHSLRKDLPPSLYPAHGILPDPAARARHARIVMNYPVRFGDLDLDIIRRTFGNTFK